MTSIFIWKSDAPNTSKKNIRCYIGSNWILEDNEYSSKSYMYLEQIVIPEFNDSVITFQTKNMPQDWVGSDLLEVTSVPYEFVKSDNYGTLEKLGEWTRFTLKGEITFDFESLTNEFNKVKKWIKSEKVPEKQIRTEYKPAQTNLNPNRIHLDFQEFLIKYSFPIPTDTNVVNETKGVNINNKYNNNKSNKHYQTHNKQYKHTKSC
jgi:hypothetical protein